MSSFQYEDVSAATLASSSWCVLKFFHCITLAPSLAGLTVKLPFRMFGLCGRKHWSHSLSPETLRWCVLGRVRILNLGPRLTYDPGLFLAVRSPLTDFCSFQQGAIPDSLIHQRRRTSLEEKKRRLVLNCLHITDWPDTFPHPGQSICRMQSCVSSWCGWASPSPQDVRVQRCDLYAPKR